MVAIPSHQSVGYTFNEYSLLLTYVPSQDVQVFHAALRFAKSNLSYAELEGDWGVTGKQVLRFMRRFTKENPMDEMCRFEQRDTRSPRVTLLLDHTTTIVSAKPRAIARSYGRVKKKNVLKYLMSATTMGVPIWSSRVQPGRRRDALFSSACRAALPRNRPSRFGIQGCPYYVRILSQHECEHTFDDRAYVQLAQAFPRCCGHKVVAEASRSGAPLWCFATTLMGASKSAMLVNAIGRKLNCDWGAQPPHADQDGSWCE